MWLCPTDLDNDRTFRGRMWSLVLEQEVRNLREHSRKHDPIKRSCVITRVSVTVHATVVVGLLHDFCELLIFVTVKFRDLRIHGG